MASIEKRPRQDGRAAWRAHYRTPSGEQRNKTFDRKADAERFLANVESSKNTGSFVDSVLARITVGTGPRTGSTTRPISSRQPTSGMRGSSASTSDPSGTR
jgi:hypothetical protein